MPASVAIRAGNNRNCDCACDDDDVSGGAGARSGRRDRRDRPPTKHRLRFGILSLKARLEETTTEQITVLIL